MNSGCFISSLFFLNSVSIKCLKNEYERGLFKGGNDIDDID